MVHGSSFRLLEYKVFSLLLMMISRQVVSLELCCPRGGAFHQSSKELPPQNFAGILPGDDAGVNHLINVVKNDYLMVMEALHLKSNCPDPWLKCIEVNTQQRTIATTQARQHIRTHDAIKCTLACPEFTHIAYWFLHVGGVGLIEAGKALMSELPLGRRCLKLV